MSWTKTWRMLLAVPLCGALVGGCAEERDPINRVQANALAKSFFVGDMADKDDDPEFYTAATVVDVPYGADQASAFGGLVGSMHIVKWEISEHYLNARLTYESVDGIDGHGNRQSDNGQVIASYAVDSHFDIKRAYNPSTGEELNVIEENTTDRPWYQREYFRVDWSANLIGSSRLWDPLSTDDLDTEALSYYVNDPSHPDAPHFDVGDGYFDITNRIYLKPKMIDLGFGEMPACFFRGSLVVGATYPWGNCQNSEITVRYAYRRKWAEGEPGYTDYDPIDWDGSRMNAFGLFNRQRLGWDDRYGIVDEKWTRPGQRYNIWEKSHVDRACADPDSAAIGCSPTRDGDADCNGKVEPELGEFANGTDDECESIDDPNWGSRCNRLVGKCTLPYAKRTPKTVAWYYTTNAEDKVIYESTEFATWQWDAAMRLAVQTARYSECVRTYTASMLGTPWEPSHVPGADVAGARASCAAAFPVDQSYDDAALDAVRDVNMCVKLGGRRDDCVQQGGHAPNSVAAMKPMVVLCHSPVIAADDAACGKVGLVARPGDIRYHQVNVWPNTQSVSPWGYGPSLSDPLTGEIMSAVINVYNAVTDSAAQGFLDQIRWMNGELKSSDITSASNVREWLQVAEVSKNAGGQLMSRDEVNRRVAGVAGAKLDDVKNAQGLLKQLGGADKMRQMIRALDAEVLPPGTVPADNAIFQQRIKRAKETGVEADLLNPMWLQMAGVQSDMPPETQLEMASPLRGMSSQHLLKAYDATQKQLAEMGQCVLSAPEPTSIPALSKIMQRKFPLLAEGATPQDKKARLQGMWDYLRFKMNFTVILHEMGHTIGLRHNFVSSYDKYNFKTQYWQLRTDSGKNKKVCDGPQQDGADCIGPRYYDPITDDEADNSIWTWQQSTVMDYAGDVTQDMLGLGVYDLAATRMFYADVVDVRADTKITEPIGDVVRDLVDYPGYLFGQIPDCPTGTECPGGGSVGHYSYYNEAFKLVQPERCVPVAPAPPAWWGDYLARNADLGNFMGEWDPVFDGNIVHDERCARPPVDYVQWSDMVSDQIVVDFDDPQYFTPRRAAEKCWSPDPQDPKECLDGSRPRVPYGFLTDGYADGWTPSAFRHDNGADMYEEMVFHSNLYENRHLFDNFRRGRVNFTVYGAYQRALSRYHQKVGNLTQGFAYTVDFILREFAKTIGAPFSVVTAANIGEGSFLYDHAVAASVALDHFTRVLLRPEIGEHYCDGNLLGCDPNGDRILHPLRDVIGGLPAGNASAGFIPNGSWRAGDTVEYGGRPLSNGFQYNAGHWTFDYLNQAGSYYEKTFAFERMLDASYGGINFYRYDGLDARFHHVNFADIWPEQFRRLIGLTLTDDQKMLAARIGSGKDGKPAMEEQLDENGQKTGIKYPSEPIAWLSFVPKDGPVACRPVDGIMACTDSLGVPIANGAPDEQEAWFIDPQIGYEVQKFVVFWYYVYQPREEVSNWVDLLRIYRLGSDTNPDYLPAQVREWRDPESGLRYMARSYGTETIFGKQWDKGIAAKMIQWANELTAAAYELDPNEPFDPVTGAANVKLDAEGNAIVKGSSGACDDSVPCLQVRKYRGLVDFTRDTAARLGFPEPALQILQPPD